MLSLNMPVQRLKVAMLPLDLPCSGPVTHSGEILTTGKSHGKKTDRFFFKTKTWMWKKQRCDTNVKYIPVFTQRDLGKDTAYLAGQSCPELTFRCGTSQIWTCVRQWRTQEFCSGWGAGSTNSVEDRGQREPGSGGGSPPSQGFWRQL